MIIVPVDYKNNLFGIENIVPAHLVKEMLETDWLAQPWYRQEWQENYSRRKIDSNLTVAKIDKHLNSILPEINDACGTKLEHCHSIMWLDDPGFTIGRHIDNDGVTVSMQLYWSLGDSELGTSFYSHPSDTNKLRYKCPYVVNTGYLMINAPDQWHEMSYPVPASTYRLSSYTYFG